MKFTTAFVLAASAVGVSAAPGSRCFCPSGEGYQVDKALTKAACDSYANADVWYNNDGSLAADGSNIDIRIDDQSYECVTVDVSTNKVSAHMGDSEWTAACKAANGGVEMRSICSSSAL